MAHDFLLFPCGRWEKWITNITKDNVRFNSLSFLFPLIVMCTLIGVLLLSFVTHMEFRFLHMAMVGCLFSMRSFPNWKTDYNLTTSSIKQPPHSTPTKRLEISKQKHVHEGEEGRKNTELQSAFCH